MGVRHQGCKVCPMRDWCLSNLLRKTRSNLCHDPKKGRRRPLVLLLFPHPCSNLAAGTTGSANVTMEPGTEVEFA